MFQNWLKCSTIQWHFANPAPVKILARFHILAIYAKCYWITLHFSQSDLKSGRNFGRSRICKMAGFQPEPISGTALLTVARCRTASIWLSPACCISLLRSDESRSSRMKLSSTPISLSCTTDTHKLLHHADSRVSQPSAFCFITIRQTRLAVYGDRAFSAATVWVWNGLLQHIISAPILLFFVSVWICRAKMQHRAKFHQNPPSWICLGDIWTTHEGYFVVFITVQNLVAIDAVQ